MAASGIGAILSPPTLGAAAFIIAEILEVSYLQVLVYALVPSVLYYIGILLAIEADARRHQVKGLDLETPGVLKLLVRWGYHFSSLFLIVFLLAIGFSAFRSVIIATVVAFLLSFLDRRDWMGPKQVWEALVAGSRGVLPIAATTAAAGIIVAVVSLTGLGLKLSGLIVDLSGGSLALTAIFAAIAVLILGLAVPVTASFIIAAAVVAPALVALGVEDFAAYMFIFYYAVLSEVSPPTALSAFAAAAITGGNGFRTMMLTCRYTLPAFLVPFAFVLAPKGEGLLLQGGAATIAFAIVVSIIAVIALGLALEGWLKGEIAHPGPRRDRRRRAAAAVARADRSPPSAWPCWPPAWRCTSRRGGARPPSPHSRAAAAASHSQSARRSRDDGGASLVLALVDDRPRGVGVGERGDDRRRRPARRSPATARPCSARRPARAPHRGARARPRIRRSRAARAG